MNNSIKPESDEGFKIGSKLIDLTNESFQGNTELMEKFWEIRKKPSLETGLVPISEEVLEFAERCIHYVEK